MNNDPLTNGLAYEQQAELGDLSQLEHVLSAYEAAEPDHESLLTQLQAFMPEKPTASIVPELRGWRYWLRLAQSQLSLIDSLFWWGSGFLLTLGIALIFAGGGMMAIVYALTSPILAVIGTAYILRSDARSLREFELLSVINPMALLYTRLLLILTYNAGLTLTLVLLAWSQDTQIILWRLLLIWFGPMVGLTGIALYASLRWSTITGIVLPLGLWASLLFLGWRDMVLHNTDQISFFTAVTLATRQSDILLLISILALIAGCMMIRESGRQIEMRFAP